MTVTTPTPFAALPAGPCFAVIFSSQAAGDGELGDDYATTAARMEALAATIPGFLGVESARGADGFGITVSYWASEAAIAEWRRHAEHAAAQARGQREWYAHYELRVARVERAYRGPRT